jgi:hypothetical protein
MKYSSQGKWLIHDIFSSPLEVSLDPTNRWYKLANALPWDKIEKIYNSTLRNEHNGAGNKSARMIVGALIVKHQSCYSDIETIEQIRENPYLQYFIGLSEFSNITIFDPSLFVSIRKRLGIENINEITRLLMQELSPKESEGKQISQDQASTDKKEANENSDQNTSNCTDEVVLASDSSTSSLTVESFVDEAGRLHSGSLIIDATCCDAEVKYPTDIDVLNDAVNVSARVLKRLSAKTGSPEPCTFEKVARSKFLEVVKKKRKSKCLIRKGISSQLEYLRRHIDKIVSLIAHNGTSCIKLLKQMDQQFIYTCIKVYHQQKSMYDQKVHQCKDRIISVFQPHVRPIVRGKSKAKVEFGSKIGSSVVRGYTFIDRYSWDAYNESEDLKAQVENYVKRFGCWPVKCYADKIYLTRENRKWLKDNTIQAAGKPLGRPTKEMQTEEYKQQSIHDKGVRNGVEATFGTGKRVYQANDIRAKLPDTGDTWTAMCFFVKNIKKFLKDILFGFLPMLDIFSNKLNMHYNLLRNGWRSLFENISLIKFFDDYLCISPAAYLPGIKYTFGQKE